jgi:putative addiction module component (TIGR02574 family)
MRASLMKIESELMKLSPRTRARLVRRLLSSLDGEPESASEESWITEAARRDEELQSGKAKGIPTETVFKRARSVFCRTS